MKRCKWTLAAIPVFMVAAAHAAPSPEARVQIAPAVHQDVLPSLRNVVPDSAGYNHYREHEEHRIPLPYTPPNQVDGALQDYRGAEGPFAPTFLSGVDG